MAPSAGRRYAGSPRAFLSRRRPRPALRRAQQAIPERRAEALAAEVPDQDGVDTAAVEGAQGLEQPSADGGVVALGAQDLDRRRIAEGRASECRVGKGRGVLRGQQQAHGQPLRREPLYLFPHAGPHCLTLAGEQQHPGPRRVVLEQLPRRVGAGHPRRGSGARALLPAAPPAGPRAAHRPAAGLPARAR